jgi:hypothetical protein
MAMLVVRTGGQSGVDRAALDVALARNIEYAGWCPRGGWAEDFPDPPGILARYPHLKETPSSDPDQRTAWNVRDSDATLLILPEHGSVVSPGTVFTRTCAELIFVRPFLEITLTAPSALGASGRWIRDLVAIRGRDNFTLNVAGPRESEAPGVYQAAYDFLRRLAEQCVV